MRSWYLDAVKGTSLSAKALRWYLPAEAPVEDENDALPRIYKSHAALQSKQEMIQESIFALQELALPKEIRRVISDHLDEVAYLSQLQKPSLSDAAIQTRYQVVDRTLLQSWTPPVSGSRSTTSRRFASTWKVASSWMLAVTCT